MTISNFGQALATFVLKEFTLLWIVTVGHCVEEDIIKQHY